jgi:Putative lumazine-binding
MRIHQRLTLTAILLLGAGHGVAAQGPTTTKTSADHHAVAAASLAYIDALYRADSTLILAAVHPTLTKRGYIREDNGGWREGSMTYTDLLRLSARWNKSGQEAGSRSPRDVKVLEVLDHTAVTRVTAEWGTDFLMLAKYPEGWRIVSIVWQTPPRP